MCRFTASQLKPACDWVQKRIDAAHNAAVAALASMPQPPSLLPLPADLLPEGLRAEATALVDELEADLEGLIDKERRFFKIVSQVNGELFTAGVKAGSREVKLLAQSTDYLAPFSFTLNMHGCLLTKMLRQATSFLELIQRLQERRRPRPEAA